jgi:hypothetical protein
MVTQVEIKVKKYTKLSGFGQMINYSVDLGWHELFSL